MNSGHLLVGRLLCPHLCSASYKNVRFDEGIYSLSYFRSSPIPMDSQIIDTAAEVDQISTSGPTHE